MDSIDYEILKRLENNAKITVLELSNHLNLTKTPIYERIKRLEKDGYIQGYRAELNPKKLNKGMIVFCSVSLEVQKIEEINKFRTAVLSLDEVYECYLMGGSNDFLLKVMVADLDEYHHFSSGKLAALNNVSQIKSSFVLDTVKQSKNLLSAQ